jgi:hypothetical protein
MSFPENFFRFLLRHSHDFVFSGDNDISRPHHDAGTFAGGISGHAGLPPHGDGRVTL